MGTGAKAKLTDTTCGGANHLISVARGAIVLGRVPRLVDIIAGRGTGPVIIAGGGKLSPGAVYITHHHFFLGRKPPSACTIIGGTAGSRRSTSCRKCYTRTPRKNGTTTVSCLFGVARYAVIK